MSTLELPLAEADTPRTLIDELLEEQQQLTAVERFVQKHERNALPAQARFYRELIPLEQPRPGEQYAFAVDLDACTGCKACVSACHSLNGLDDGEAWRDVGLIVGGSSEEPYLQTVTTACHHCAEPGCLLGCPVGAYEKDAETGIVRHLDDQCIGCQYCILKCPYDVPKYSKKRGIVRKCDMCYQRLAADEAPACVQACPNGAITIRIADVAQARAQAVPGVRLIHGAFESSYTKPTTSFTTRRGMPLNAQPGDVYRLRLEHPHWPLIAMLLLSQLSAGVFVVVAIATLFPSAIFAKVSAPLVFAGFAALQAGLALSVLHLGQPLKAWRFFLGLRTSWMSREILAFGLFGAASGGLAILCVSQLEMVQPFLQRPLAHELVGYIGNVIPSVAWLTAFTAIAGIICSVMIYVDTRRPFWVASLTFPTFFGTTLVLGASASSVILGIIWGAAPELLPMARLSAIGALVIRMLFAAWEVMAFRHSLLDLGASAHRSARTMWQLLRPQLWLRAALVLGAVVFGCAACLSSGPLQVVFAATSFVLNFGAAILERFCFFTASDAPRMPGGIAS